MRWLITLPALWIMVTGCQPTMPAPHVPSNSDFDLDLEVAGNLDRAYQEAEARLHPDELKLTRTFDNYSTFATSLSAANSAKLYRGAPLDESRRDGEREVISLGAYDFYDGPAEVTGAQLDRIQELISLSSTVYPFMGYPNCDDGFHPDWRLAWNDGSDGWYADFCFGCSELQVFRNDSRLIYCRLRDTPSLSAAFLRCE